MTKKSLKQHDFLEYFTSQPKNSDYWEDWDRFCKEALAGCEVCWTCLYYHIRNFRCNIPVPDGKPISWYAGNKIKNPEWFRCNRWWPKGEGRPEDE